MGKSVRQIFQQPQISWVVFPNCWGTLHYCAYILHVPNASRTAQVITKKKVIGKSQAFLCDLIFSVGRGEQWGENTKTNYNTTHCGWQYKSIGNVPRQSWRMDGGPELSGEEEGKRTECLLPRMKIRLTCSEEVQSTTRKHIVFFLRTT